MTRQRLADQTDMLDLGRLGLDSRQRLPGGTGVPVSLLIQYLLEIRLLLLLVLRRHDILTELELSLPQFYIVHWSRVRVAVENRLVIRRLILIFILFSLILASTLLGQLHGLLDELGQLHLVGCSLGLPLSAWRLLRAGHAAHLNRHVTVRFLLLRCLLRSMIRSLGAPARPT